MFNLKGQLGEWSSKNSTSIKNAIDKIAIDQFFANKIDCETAFLPFLECSAIYLRDFEKVSKATEEFEEHQQDGKPETREAARILFSQPYTPIEEFASSIGLEYRHILDLVHESPTESRYLVGPFCGAFYSTSELRPFIGLVFKGTDPVRIGEVLVDVIFKADDEMCKINGKLVSKGVFRALFDTYKSISDSPYNYILKKLKELAESLFEKRGAAPRLHVVGHSLGGSYSQLFYSKLMTDFPSPKEHEDRRYTTGDLYTFGAPRIGTHAWATEFNQKQFDMNGLTHRIVNKSDVIPQVPPISILPSENDFCHVGDGWTISANEKDTVSKLESEEQKSINPYNIKNFSPNDAILHCKLKKLRLSGNVKKVG